MEEKPRCQLTGEDGNVFAVIGRVTRALKKAGQKKRADEFMERALSAGSYDRVLSIAEEYVDGE